VLEQSHEGLTRQVQQYTFDLCYANQIRPNFVEMKLHALQINLQLKLCTQFDF
jgi:hypothetical protein